ncbi:hypothetical protein MTP99_011592 [Tenebrio molitor]|nr:hypothetical protein MTP99_011592 [Tenebrio molitor]
MRSAAHPGCNSCTRAGLVCCNKNFDIHSGGRNSVRSARSFSIRRVDSEFVPPGGSAPAGGGQDVAGAPPRRDISPILVIYWEFVYGCQVIICLTMPGTHPRRQ